VYLDQHQVFTQWIFPRELVPLRLEERFAWYVRPLVETYHHWGIEATWRPINDVHVRGRKIGGTGAASIGEAEILVGSLMLDFDTRQMARVLKVASEKMRDKVFESLEEYMTTMHRELGTFPDRDAVVETYLECCAAALGAEIEFGTLTSEEEAMTAELDERFASEEWLYQRWAPPIGNQDPCRCALARGSTQGTWRPHPRDRADAPGPHRRYQHQR